MVIYYCSQKLSFILIQVTVVTKWCNSLLGVVVPLEIQLKY